MLSCLPERQMSGHKQPSLHTAEPLFQKRAAIVQGKEEAPSTLEEGEEEEEEEERTGKGVQPDTFNTFAQPAVKAAFLISR